METLQDIFYDTYYFLILFLSLMAYITLHFMILDPSNKRDILYIYFSLPYISFIIRYHLSPFYIVPYVYNYFLFPYSFIILYKGIDKIIHDDGTSTITEFFYIFHLVFISFTFFAEISISPNKYERLSMVKKYKIILGLLIPSIFISYNCLFNLLFMGLITINDDDINSIQIIFNINFLLYLLSYSLPNNFISIKWLNCYQLFILLVYGYSNQQFFLVEIPQMTLLQTFYINKNVDLIGFFIGIYKTYRIITLGLSGLGILLFLFENEEI